VAFLKGLILGLSMILPIGPQNLFVLNQGLLGGLKRGFLAAAVAGFCDTVLILAGAAGLSAVLLAFPWLRSFLLWLGVAFLLWLGVGALRARPAAASTAVGEGQALPVRQVVLTVIGVSWGNPHAILDTVAILGSAIAGQAAVSRLAFGAGAVSASWLFFALLALTGSYVGRRLTPSAAVWIQRGSGIIMLIFAVVLALEAGFSEPWFCRGLRGLRGFPVITRINSLLLCFNPRLS